MTVVFAAACLHRVRSYFFERFKTKWIFNGNAAFEEIEHRPGITAAGSNEKRFDLILCLKLLSVQYSVQIRSHCLVIKCLQLKKMGAGTHRSSHTIVGVFCRCPNNKRTVVFHKREKYLLLVFTQTMYLIDKNERLLKSIGIIFENFTELFYFQCRCIHFIKRLIKYGCNNSRKCRLAGAWRSVKESMRKCLCLNKRTQGCFWTQQVTLSRYLIEYFGTVFECQIHFGFPAMDF